jgi:hypothetical protein
MNNAERNAEYQRLSRAKRKADSDRRRAAGQVKLEVWLDADAAKVMDDLTRGADDKREAIERVINSLFTGQSVSHVE